MKYSYQRDVILNETINLNHPNVETIYEKVRSIIPNISLGTVYRNLNQLVENNLLKKITINNNFHFDKTLEEHFHFYCKNCLKVYDVDLNLNIDTKHQVNSYNIELVGICQECGRKE